MFLVIHSVAHVMNAQNFSTNFNNQYLEINWAKYKGQVSNLPLIQTK